ncbi:MAG: hypothetical protein ABL931_20225, partial [Usitatibacteraceae bacterium]
LFAFQILRAAWPARADRCASRLLRFVAGAALCGAAQLASAQASPPIDPFFASLTVVPAVAPPGVARTLVINGVWPNGCVPRSAAVRAQDAGSRPTLIVELKRAPPDSVCTLAIERFSFSLNYAPTTAGVQPVIIQTDDGARGGDGAISTVSAASNFVLTPIITVVPDVDVPNRARTIVVSGQTLAGCPFATPVLDVAAGLLVGGVVIRMDAVPTFAPCTTNVTEPYRFELPYTPTAKGTQRVIVASASGQIRSESRMRTATVQGHTRGVGDITGVWYDRSTDGSGVQFTHNFAGTDFVFGTWYAYDLNGRARWLSIQNVVWQSGGSVLAADLFETRSIPAPCSTGGCPDVVAPASSSSMAKIGTVRFSFTGLEPYSDTLAQGVAQAFSLAGAPLFTSNITRIGL